VNEDVVTLAERIGSLNVADTAVTAKPVALLSGTVEITVGRVVSGAPAGSIVREKGFESVPPPDTVTVKLDGPAVVGVPLKTPAVLRLSPAGGLPAVTDQIKGGVPPVAVNVWLYAVPTVPAGSGLAVVIVGAAAAGSFASPGKVNAAISALFVPPVPSEFAAPSVALKVWFPIPALAKSVPYAFREPPDAWL
jgi:hypothetical protein